MEVSIRDDRVYQKVFDILTYESGMGPHVDRDAVRRNLTIEIVGNPKSGANCQVCGARHQIYRRTINKGMLRAICQMYEIRMSDPSRPIHITQLDVSGGDFAKLRFWGLIYQEHSQEDGSPTGWRITDKGLRFLREKDMLIYCAVYLFHGQLIGFDPGLVRANGLSGVQGEWSPKASFSLDTVRASDKDRIILV